MQVGLGIFLILHGLVHLFYFAVSRDLFAPEMPVANWPHRSWMLSQRIAETNIRSLASKLYLVATVVFVITGLAVLFGIGADAALVVIASLFSSLLVIVFWNGTTQHLPDQGFIGVLINLALIGIVALA